MRSKPITPYNHPEPEVYNSAVQWAKKVLANSFEYVVIDFTSTGYKSQDVVLGVAIMNLQGEVLVDQPIQPRELSKLNDLSKQNTLDYVNNRAVKLAPYLTEVLPQIKAALHNKKVISYNGHHISSVFSNTLAAEPNAEELAFSSTCLMHIYSSFAGQVSTIHHNYTWQKLPRAESSTPVDDCRAIIKLLRHIAAQKEMPVYREENLKITVTNPSDFNEQVEWARNVLANPNDYCILDTETTGVKRTDVILQLAIIDLQGKTLFNSLIKPSTRKRWPEAQKIHGITPQMVQDQPTFKEIVQEAVKHLDNKTVIIYNADFDENLITQTSLADGFYLNLELTTCLMKRYAAFMQQYNMATGDYKWHKLKGDHTALGDCLAALKLIQKMASAQLIEIQKPESVQPVEPLPVSPKPESLQPQEPITNSQPLISFWLALRSLFPIQKKAR